MSAGWKLARSAQIAVVIACAFGLAGLSLRTTVDRVPPSDLSIFGAPFRPDAVLRDSVLNAQTGRGIFDDQSYANVMRAAQALPLDERPFFLVALRALARGDEARGRALLEEARRRNPRFRIARIILLDRWMRSGDKDRAISEMTALARILPGAQSVLVTELAQLARNPGTSETARHALSGDLILLNAVLSAMSRQGASPTEILRFAGPSAPVGLETGGWRRTLIDGLVERGDYATARSVWSDAAHVSQAEQKQLVFDAALTGRMAPPPFNWTLTGNGVGEAAIAKGAMSVEFYGRLSGDLASQLLVLSPGSYRLRVAVQGLDSGDGSGLGWTVTCSGPGGASLLISPPIANKPTARTIVAPFVVPSTNCGAQWLKLVGTAGEFASPVSIRILQISLDRQP